MRSPQVKDLGGFSFLRLPEIAVSFMMQKLRRVLIGLSVICLDGCVYHDLPEYSCVQPYSFVADIKPIIETRCAISGCHNGDLGADKNWLNAEEFHKRVASGLVKYRVTHRIMPPSFSPAGPLTQEQISAIACWTDQSAPNN